MDDPATEGAKQIKILSEELRKLKGRARRFWLEMIVGSLALIANASGFWILAANILAQPREWDQIGGVLALCLMWVCLVAVVLRFSGHRQSGL